MCCEVESGTGDVKLALHDKPKLILVVGSVM